MPGGTVIEVGADGIALLAINNPPLNLLSIDVMLSLKKNIEGALLRDDVKAIVITGSGGKFSAGYDVTAFGGTQRKKTRKELGFMSIEFITDTLEAARKPLVAAIEGPAFGGGLEIALACHARISTPSAQLGLTELQYGIIPGFGGTQRLPRLVGLRKALEMILMSKRVNGEEAQIISLVDAIVPADELLRVARQWALDIAEYRRPWVISLYKTDKLEPMEEARAILNAARLRAQRQNPNVMHPLVCIDVIEQGVVSGPRDALWKEAEALQELRQTSTCRSLVHIFLAQRLTSKIPGISTNNLQPRKINKVAIIGGDLMSSKIATLLVLRDYQVILKEKTEKRLLEEISRVKGNLQNHVKNGKEMQEKLKKAFSLLKGVLDYENFKDVDLVIETESGSLSVKQEIFANLEKYCPLHCILTSDSSTFSLKLIGERTRCQNRIAGINFYRMIDMLGLKVFAAISKKFVENLPDSSYKPKLVHFLQHDSREGECNGKGFYKYDKRNNACPDPEIRKYIEKARNISDATMRSELSRLSDSEVVEMILFPALNEAFRIVSEGVVVRPSDLDVASVLGMAFPAYRGGIIYWSESVGSNYICSRLEKWSTEYGDFFKPCAYVTDRAAKRLSLANETKQAKSQL